MTNYVLITVCKSVAGVASCYLILRFFNLKGWRYFNEYNRLKGKTFIITGANSGIGKELARQIAAAGGNVIMLCRDDVAGESVLNELMVKGSKMGSITLRRMDLNSFSSIEKTVKELLESVPRIDCLINNAGVMMAPYSVTEDGFEGHIQANHLGHALLTTLLLPKIAASGRSQDPSRVVFVSSMLYRRGTFRDYYLKPHAITKDKFHEKTAYSDSKLASLMYARQLSSEVKRLGYPVVINSVSPGMVYTNLGRHFKSSWYKKMFTAPFKYLFTRTTSEAASIILHAAASKKTIDSNGTFYQAYARKAIESKFDYELSKKVFQLTMEALKKNPPYFPAFIAPLSDSIEPEDPYAKAIYFKNAGNKYFKQGEIDQALNYYSKAIECCPSSKTSDLSIFYQNRAAVHEINKNYEAVIEECTKAIKLNKKYVKALSRRAKALEALGFISDALKDITAVDILENFQNRNNLLITDRLLKQLAKTKAKEYFSKREFAEPSKHFIKNYFSSYCRDPLIDNTDDLDAQKLYSILDDLRKEKEKATDDNVNAKIALLEGTIEIMKGNVSIGEKKLQEVIKMDNIDGDIKVNALIKLGTLKVQEVDDNSAGAEESFRFFDKAIEIDPNNQDIYIHRAQIYLLAEKIEDASKDLEKCCSLAPDFASAVAQKLYFSYRMAFRSEDHEKIQESYKSFEEAVEKFPKATEVYSLFAQMLTEQGDYKKADKLFLKAIEVDPHDANLIVHRGILAMQGNPNSSIELLEQAIKTDNKSSFAYEMLGTIEVQRGNLSKAIECFDRALENASTEMDCAHLFSLREAAISQIEAVKSLEITIGPATAIY